MAGCAATVPAARCDPAAGGAGVVWVVDHGWHTEIGLPADDIVGPLAVYRTLFPGARVLMFGFGKRTWLTAKVQSVSELIMGPVPGPGAMQVTALASQPADAYDAPVTALPLPPEGGRLLSDYIWRSVAKTRTGEPRLISAGFFPGSAFYATTPSYSLTFNCNAWTADALRAATLPVTPTDVIFARSVLQQTAQIGRACLMTETPEPAIGR